MGTKKTSIFLMIAVIMLFMFVGNAEAAEVTVPVYAEGTETSIEATSGIDLTKMEDKVKYWKFGIWHHASGFWDTTLDDGTYKKVDDSQLIDITGVSSAFNFGDVTFTHDITKGSALDKAINAGKNVYLNIGNAGGVTNLKAKFDLGVNIFTGKYDTNADGSLKNASAKIVKLSDGTNQIQITLKTLLNYYSDKQLSYRTNYSIMLANQIPFVVNGYGNQMYSVSGNGIAQGNVAGSMIDASKPHMKTNVTTNLSMLGTAFDGSIHPDMILDATGALKSGYFIDIDVNKNGSLTDAVDKIHFTTDGLSIGGGGATFSSGSASGLSFRYVVGMNIFTAEPTTVDMGIIGNTYSYNNATEQSTFDISGLLKGRELVAASGELPAEMTLSWETWGGQTGTATLTSNTLKKDVGERFIFNQNIKKENGVEPGGVFTVTINPRNVPVEGFRVNNVYDGEFGTKPVNMLDFGIDAPFRTFPIINDGSSATTTFKAYVRLDNTDTNETTSVSLYRMDGSKLIADQNITVDGGSSEVVSFTVPLASLAEGSNNLRLVVNKY